MRPEKADIQDVPRDPVLRLARALVRVGASLFMVKSITFASKLRFYSGASMLRVARMLLTCFPHSSSASRFSSRYPHLL